MKIVKIYYNLFREKLIEKRQVEKLNYVYGIIWLIIAGLLFFKFTKENKIFYVAALFFTIMGIWWIADAIFVDANMFEGAWGIALRVIGGFVLVVFVGFYYKRYRNKG